MIVAATLGLGLLIGLSLGALGGGGSVLTVPALVYVIGQDARAATTSSLFIVGITSAIAALGHARSGRVRWGVGVAFGITGIAAGFAGTVVNRLVDPDVLLLGFATVIVVAAVGMLASSGDETLPREEGDAPQPARRRTAGWIGRIAGAGLLVGFMTGLFGVGGGFVIVPALTLALGMSMPRAVGTSLVVISINSGGALLARAGTAQFDWAVIVPFTLAAVAGSLGGARVASRVSGTTLTRVFAVLLLAVAAYTATSSLISLFG
ncbi:MULTISPECIES: sulfite exporter TauE/SafE family protein [unclassified Blastococcus]|uniref:sulfite exporter TauE/SafE family protein n=1 Tax=unclassified Blastococcus TaxID=2619396 RepID=UPI001EEFB64B|nr:MULTISPECIES: sulfite exporter TauE/SafE family protein [unclassified Blastococcus]